MMPEIQREAVRELLRSSGDFEMLADVNAVEDLERNIECVRPDVVVTTMSTAAASAVHQLLPAARVVEITPDGSVATLRRQVSTRELPAAVRWLVRFDDAVEQLSAMDPELP